MFSTIITLENIKRIRTTIFNDRGNIVYIKEGSLASITSLTYRLDVNELISIKD